MNFKVYEFYLEFMNKGFNFVKSSSYDLNINETQFLGCLSIINFVRDQFKDLSRALEISFLFLIIYMIFYNIYFHLGLVVLYLQFI